MIQAPRSALLQFMERASQCAATKSPMPAFMMTVLAVEGNTLHGSSSDDENSFTTKMEVEGGEDFRVLVNGKALMERLRTMPDDMVYLEVMSGECKVRVSNNSTKRRFELSGMPFGEARATATTPAEKSWTRVQIADLRRLLGSCRHAISQDATRVVNAALFTWRNHSLGVVGTDGHRLMVSSTPDQNQSHRHDDCLIPLLSLPHLLRVLDWAQQAAKSEEESFVHVAFEQQRMFVITSVGTYSTKLRDGQFPPYESVIPDRHNNARVTTKVSREALIGAIKAVRVACAKDGIDFVLGGGKLVLQVKDPANGEATDEVAVDYLGDQRIVRVEGNYVLDSLDAIRTDEVELSCETDLDPIVLSPVYLDKSVPHMDQTSVVMPMRR